MKIHFNRKRLNYNLIPGIIWLTIGLLSIFTIENPYLTGYGFLILSCLFLGTYAYERKNHYLTIKNGQIYKNYPFSKKMNLSEIKRIKKSVGEYILKSDKTRLIINTAIIESNSLTSLKVELKKLPF